MDDFEPEERNVLSSGTKTTETIKYLDVMDLLETQPIIYRIITNMSGLEKKTIDGEVRFIREFQPNFTDEFTKQVGTTLLFHANQVSSYSCIPEENINQYLRNRMNTEIKRIFTIGRDNYISHLSWQKIMDIHKKGAVRKVGVYNKNEKIGEKEYKVSGWYPILNKDWSPEGIITQQMLNHVRDKAERADYNTIGQGLWLDIFQFMRSSLYLSREIEGGFGNLQAHSQNSQTVTNQSYTDAIRKPSVMQRIKGKFSRIGSEYR